MLNGREATLSGKMNESLFDILKRQEGIFKNLCCQKGQCGRCHVLLDSKEVPSCLVPLYQMDGRAVFTLDSFLASREYQHFMAFLQKKEIVFCHQCTDALIFHMHFYLQQFPDLFPQELPNLFAEIPCRCGTRDSLRKILLQFLNQRKNLL